MYHTWNSIKNMLYFNIQLQEGTELRGIKHRINLTCGKLAWNLGSSTQMFTEMFWASTSGFENPPKTGSCKCSEWCTGKEMSWEGVLLRLMQPGGWVSKLAWYFSSPLKFNLKNTNKQGDEKGRTVSKQFFLLTLPTS